MFGKGRERLMDSFFLVLEFYLTSKILIYLGFVWEFGWNVRGRHWEEVERKREKSLTLFGFLKPSILGNS